RSKPLIYESMPVKDVEDKFRKEKIYVMLYNKGKGIKPSLREEEIQVSVRQTNKKNKHEQAYSIIRERIFNGTYVPGYRLVIDGLARELGISPVPIREAIRLLEAEGWVEYRPNAGAQVAAADANKYEEEMT